MPTTVLTPTGPRPVDASQKSTPLVRFDDRLVLIDFELCGSSRPTSRSAGEGAKASGVVFGDSSCSHTIVSGGTARLRTRWLVTGELAGRAKPQVVAALVSTTRRDDDRIVTGSGAGFTTSLTPLEWQPGDVVDATIDLSVPASGPAHVVVGVVDAGRRWNATGPHDVVDGLAQIASIDAAGGDAEGVVVDDGLPVVQAKRRTAPIVIDGVLDEADWATAVVVTLGPYKVGAPAPTQATTARLLWDDASLYLAFDVDDDDPFSPYTRNDEPLYDSEALEIFIDADGDRDVYVELQASPTDVRFDAAFAGGARKNMDVGFNHAVEVKHAARAGGYTQEWRIPVAGLKDVPPGEPKVGARWRINMFRLERRRSGDVVTSTEASAWSTVLANDFHGLDRFGRVVFVD